MPLILGTNSIKETGYEVANSCRFNVGSNDFLSRTIGTPTDEDKWTFSVWLKITGEAPSVQYGILSSGNYPSAYETIHLNGSDQLFYHYNDGGGVNHGAAKYSGIIRDPSAWYNLIVSRNGTAVKIYVNGNDVTTTVTSYNNSTNVINKSGGTLRIGHSERETSGRSWNGYMSEVVFCDGQLLDQTSFGEFDDSGIWKPIDVSGLTFGNNGFYLDFEDSSALGNDVSGNNNDFTASNLTAIDQSTDTCTNNFATLNPLATGSLITLSEGNLKATGNNASDSSTTTATIGITSGKFYWEAKIVNVVSGYPYLGIYEDFDSLVQGNLQGQANGTRVMTVYVVGGGTTLFKPSTDLTITAPANNDIIMFAVDKDNNKFYLGVNGTWYNSGDPTSGATGTGSLADLDANGVVMFGSHNYNNSATELNFGSPSFSISSGNTDGNGYGNFEYAVPSGYYSLCTKNLSEFG